MGFAPMANPQVLVVVTLNGTHGENGFGGHTAAPVFKVVAGEALRVFDVPKDLPENVPGRTLVAGNAEDLNDLAIADLGESRRNILEESEEAEGQAGLAPGPQANVAAPPDPKRGV